MVHYSTGALDRTFAALADPTRRAILERLAGGDACVTELAEPFDMSLPAVSKHLRVLESAGLVARSRDGRLHRLALVPAPLRGAGQWIALYRRFWERQLDALAAYLGGATSKEKTQWAPRRPGPKPRFASRGPSRPRGTRSSRPGRGRRR